MKKKDRRMRNAKGQFIKGNSGYWFGKKRTNLTETNAVKTMFKKGQVPWNKGKKWPKEMIARFSKSHIGKHLGENNGNWRGGVYKENLRERWSFDYKKWRKEVFKRDNYTCQMCGFVGVPGKRIIFADHIKRFCENKEMRYDLNNGQTLCKKCHNIKTSLENRESWVNQYSQAKGVMPYA